MTGEPRGVLGDKHHGRVSSVSFARDGSLLATGELGGIVRLWHVASGRELGVQYHHRDPAWWATVSISPDGSLIASCGHDDAVRVWRVAEGRAIGSLQYTFEHRPQAVSLAFAPSGDVLVSGGWDGTIRFWDLRSGAALGGFQAHEAKAEIGWVNAVAFSPDGMLLASAGFDHTVRIWNSDLRSVAEIDRRNVLTSVRTLTAKIGAVNSVAFSRDGTMLASGCAAGLVHLWGIP
jgi:WD40 repeat protein